MFHELPKDEFWRTAETFAGGLAAADYKRGHPGCTEEEARKHALRHWRAMLQDALEFMMLSDFIEEGERAAPWN
jgi:hypothetical protein